MLLASGSFVFGLEMMSMTVYLFSDLDAKWATKHAF